MSDRPCNYCNLQRYKREAKKRGNKIITKPSNFMGVCIFEVPKEMKEIPKYIEPNKKYPNGDEIYQKYRIAWIMEIGSSCAC